MENNNNEASDGESGLIIHRVSLPTLTPEQLERVAGGKTIELIPAPPKGSALLVRGDGEGDGK